MIEKKFISQKGFLSTSFDKIVALFFAFKFLDEEKA